MDRQNNIPENEDEYIILNRQEELNGNPRDENLSRERGLLREGTASAREAVELLQGYQYHDMEAILKSMRLTRAVTENAKRLCEKKAVKITAVESGFSAEGNASLTRIAGEGLEGRSVFPMELVFSRDSVEYGECQCSQCKKHYYYRYYRREFCPYLGALMLEIQEQLTGKNIGDATDKQAFRLLEAFSGQHANEVVARAQEGGRKMTVQPRIIQKGGELWLSYKICGEKSFIIKNLAEFYDNVLNSRNGMYGSKTTLNHAIGNFDENGRGWIDFLGRVLTEEESFSQRMLEVYGSGGRNLFKSAEHLLSGWRLDDFYDRAASFCAEGVEYERKTEDGREKTVLHTRVHNPQISMDIRKNAISDRRNFHGIEVTCKMPQLFRGVKYLYFVQDGALCRIEEDFCQKVRMLADFCREGQLTFQVGRNHLTDFYYNVLPQLEGAVDIREENAEEIASYLPARAGFTFYLDAEGRNMRCRVTARYAEQEYTLSDDAESGPSGEGFRERGREQEIVFLVKRWFPYWDGEREDFHCGKEEELMYRVLEQGVETLLQLGEVQCTRRFTNININRKVRMSVGVSISGQLLNLEIATRDVPTEELLDILRSYRQKKKYYRLKNGDFLNLQEDDTLKTMDELVEALRMSPKELVKGNVKLPVYRALYLDGLLEKNEEIYSTRDSYFRQLVKSFKAVKDADFEVPASMAGTLRGYQKAGYRWMRMLEAYRFGGILADDMGLGKTLQTLAVLLSAKQEGAGGTSIVIAPASLVYNWGEEIRRFAPELSCCIISGNQEERVKKLEQSGGADVLITSYDLLKRDIAHYEGRKFRYQIIDEAQYIKNHNTAAAKAVKVLDSQTRYALTGTPIENRLSELWSIFDYLMPGYLYGYEVFRNDFESPIVKDGEKAALERLQRMTAPFILRRMKENVLKDLPEKLEESRYVKFEEEQQRLYDAQLTAMKARLAGQNQQEFQKNKMQVLAELMKLRQICCDPALCFDNYRGKSAKLEACTELVLSAVEGGHKILLFSQFTSMLELLAERLQREKISFYTITGATSKEKRIQLVKAFNEDDTNVFLISLKAGGVGLNLTGADVVIHYDPWWNLAVQNQATDRAHRIGQKRKVVVYRLIAKGTIEERIQELQESKRALSEQVIQGEPGQLAGMTREDFLSLLE